MELYNVDGTIAKVLKENQNSIFTTTNVEVIRKNALKVLSESEELLDNPAREECISIISKCNKNSLLSTLTTYLTGVNV